MSFSSQIKEEIIELKMWDNNSNLKQDEQIARLCIREAFIKSGFINNPNKDYHLEILFKTNKKALEMQKLLQSLGIDVKTTKKGNGTIIYSKDGEMIVSLLAIMGANKGVLKFEETRVMKEARNSINRIVNCETANLNKTINTAVMQIKDIEEMKKKNKFKDLNENLKEIAEIRIKNPDASYEELGKMLKKQIGKSGVNHRLKKISQIANELRRK